MSFFIPDEEDNQYTDTIDLFNKLGKLERLSHEQGESLKEYEDNREKYSDFAIEMPAGHGKTLVGGLISEFNRLNNNWRVVYACATRQLASQTHKLLEEYGISAVLLTGRAKEFSQIDLGKYQRSEAICVTTYGHIFNINPAFDDSNLIIFDDAHATEYAINDFWSVDINRQSHPDIFEALITTLGDSLAPNVYDKLTHGTYDPMTDGIDIVSFPQWYKKIDSIRSLLDSRTDDTDLYYSWSRIRNNIPACQIFVNHSNIVIKPVISPNKAHGAFNNPQERIYMSATIGTSGELERMFGVPDIHYINKFANYSNKVSGRRLILFPEDHFEGEELQRALVETINNSNRALILTPSNKSLGKVEKCMGKLLPDFSLLKNTDIEDNLTNFTNKDKAVLALSGRYEGIDLKDDECRLEIIHDLPVAVSVEEKFLQDRLNATELLNSKLLTRIIQGLGRCTRSKSDSAVVLFTGKYVGDYLYKEEFKRLLPADIHAEMDFGFKQIDFIKDVETWHESIKYFSDKSGEWSKVESFLEKQESKLLKQKQNHPSNQSSIQLYDSTSSEIEYIYSLWNEEYSDAHEAANKALNELGRNESLKGYRAWWNYLIACVATIQDDTEKTQKYLTKSLKASNNKIWLDKRDINLIGETEVEVHSDEMELQIERIGKYLNSFGDRDKKFNNEWAKILDGLRNKEAHHFEPALKALGTTLGFYAENPPNGDGIPDGVWNIGETWVSLEAKTNIEDEEGYIPFEDIRQVALQPSWVKQEHNLDYDKEITLVMICAKNKVKEASQHATDGIFILSPVEILELATSIENVLRSGLNELIYGVKTNLRNVLIRALRENHVTPEDILSRLTQRELSSIIE
ncbi:helicase C-terminal domain-containing protein [Thalassobacillus devorans]|uniref:helicase C-terminal domain-containing protein n=1 Tax=Thalassobacillus devorans TaxID=279813 RepID=UPI001593B837|nr:helicase C-terminal domain-containing protein [Thalassobacillus devorans]